ncbi:hypothetical protein NM688_g5240 [Phlebia brevispora]|uniref:Uncharacterized protein n=1 Tax=Phlebia brevispora TaxID=194682 RepID=A0ACC1SYG2_9APHY|nr:hypothetical protein NM688_g5240 [Phlebia brevispora]
MDRNPSAGATPPSLSDVRVHRKLPSRMYALQVRAFIEAAEVVDADPDTIEDILDGFDEEVFVDDDDEEEADAQDAAVATVGDVERQLVEDAETEDDEFVQYLEEAETAWTKDEVRAMMIDLKENGMVHFVREYVVLRGIPISKLLYAFGICLCPELRVKNYKTLMYFLEVAMSRELQSREKLAKYNTVDDAVNLIKNSNRIIILTGAGISVSCGIPDFRSRNGIYALLQQKGEYELDDPQQMFDIHYFRENPAVFYSFASQIYPSNFIPSPCHRFIKLVEDKGKLLRNYTQNIDTLEVRAGVQKVLQCHGSFATASCINCHHHVPGVAIEDDILNQRRRQRKKTTKKKKNAAPWESDGEEEPDVPAYPPGIMKPDITFFGEKLTDDFDKALIEDRPLVDLLLVIGTSLKVSPVSEILTHLPHSVPQILINKTPVKHINPDIVLLGNADDIVQYLCHKLGWILPEPNLPLPSEPISTARPNIRKRPSARFDQEPRRVGNSHVWLFEGAEGGKWVEDLEQKYRDSSRSRPSTPSQVANGSANGDTIPLSKKQRTK